REGRETERIAARLRSLPLFSAEIELVRRHRPVRQRAAAAVLPAGAAGCIMVLDLAEPLVDRLVNEVIEHQPSIAGIVEHGVQAIVEERQPVLDAGVPAAFADRSVEEVVATRRAEQGDILLAEAADRLAAQEDLAGRY